MHVFLRSQDYEIWRVVKSGPYELLKDESKWTEEDIKQSKVNFSAMNIMQCAIHPDEYSRVLMCNSAKEMWDNLKLIYEGTFKVKATKVNILVHKYKLFRMKLEETISKMIARFTCITNGLKALGKEYSNMDLVWKILWSLSLEWHTKATVIEDSKDLTTLTLDELIRSLMTYEFNMHKS